jgi:predicted negative regulator of RcsB-dependent stress response
VGRRLTRKEIKKKDPITETLVELWAWMLDNRRTVYIGVAVLLGAVVLYMVGSTWYQRSQSSQSLAMQKALDIYEAKVEPTQKEPKENVYATHEAKFNAALKAFEEVEKNEGSSASGLLASYYKAVCLRELGRQAEASAVLNKLEQEVDDSRQRQVIQFALAEIDRSIGKYDDAIRLLDNLEKEPDTVFSNEALAYNKALCLDEKGQYKEALELLQSTQARIQEKKKSSDQYYTPYESSISDLLAAVKAKMQQAAPVNS